MKIDLTKKYITRSGKAVTLLHRAPEGWPSPFPWRGAIGNYNTATWTDEGKYSGINVDANLDLVEVREPIEFQHIIDAKGMRFDYESDRTIHEWDSDYPNDAPHRIATFREVLP